MSERPRFDPTINLGHVITLTCVVAAVIGGWYSTDARLAAVERQIGALSTLIVENAVLGERVKSLAARMDRAEIR